jgi:hypothetical protein
MVNLAKSLLPRKPQIMKQDIGLAIARLNRNGGEWREG